VREADGLAMSSRNVHLSREERDKVCLLLKLINCFHRLV
jgi:pantothenate synthetase